MAAEAHGIPIQLARPWPDDDAVGVVTTSGRTFHRDEQCPGYQRGVREAIAKGRHVAPAEHVNAQTARQRGKGVCARCW
jgi:hypothetical protein